MTGVVIAVCLLPALAAADPPGRLDLEPEDLRPGLVAEYRSLADPKATLTRVEPKPAFHLGRSSPHPRLPSGPFEVVWSGVIVHREPGPVSFSALVGGEVSVTVDGVTLLDGRGPTDASRVTAKATLSRPPGFYRLTVRFRSLPDVPARLQLWWEGPTFAREPLPAWRLGHTAVQRTRAVQTEDLAARGRTAVGRYGCARCHPAAFPGVSDPPPGPSLADTGRRLDRAWLLNWLADPAKVRADAHMPALFAPDRAGFVERWIVTESLTGSKRPDEKATGDHRQGRRIFLSLGCAACHFVPDLDRATQRDLDRFPLTGLGDRMSAGDLVAFLGNPHGRYPDGRMPRLPVTPDEARDVAAYILLWSKPSPVPPADKPPTDQELRDTFRRLGARDQGSAAAALLREKGCTACHTGLGEYRPRDVPVRKWEGEAPAEPSFPHAARQEPRPPNGAGPHYSLPDEMRKTVTAYLAVAGREAHPSPFAARQHRLAQAGCVRCHQRDSDRPPPIEEVGSTLGGAYLEELPYLRTPRLTNPHQKFTRGYLAAAVREGVSGLRSFRFIARHSYQMPAFGPAADDLLQALAEADGELPTEADAPAPAAADPTLGTLHGSRLVGFQGYGCASCHIWNGKLLSAPDPGATGPDLTRTAGRLRRDWFDRFLENPLRFYPNTPMPAVFEHGKPATLSAILDGDPARQKDALWAYLAKGKDSPGPTPPPPVPVAAPAPGEPVLAAQAPVHLPDRRIVESISLLTGENDLLVYDLSEGAPHSFFSGAQILRTLQGRIRQTLVSGTATDLAAAPGLRVGGQPPAERTLLGYDRLTDGARVRWRLRFAGGEVGAKDTLRFNGRRLVRELRLTGVPEGANVELRSRVPSGWKVEAAALAGKIETSTADGVLTARLTPNGERTAVARVEYDLPPPRPAPKWEAQPLTFADAADGSLVRPGYRAVAYPRPKTVAGEDRVMPAAVAVRPCDGQVFVASLKTGELFALRDPTGDGKQAHFDNYARGLFQDALSMLAEDDGLYVLHRRNLTKVVDSDGDGVADRFDRVTALPHGVADTYDYAYGVARDRAGRFVLSYAPYANTKLPGSGGAVRLQPGKPPEAFAYGMRNPIGWAAGPDGDVFFTDNQGEWVAANKLSHAAEGKFHGFPNPAQRDHVSKPAGKPTVWVPYSWARSINGIAFDHTGGKFGSFAGQFFLAELMFGGAIVRANVEKVNGVYQGACFPFWGKGLLGPVSLAFDPRGRLYVGSITEPGWMAQPDRGALFRIDYTGEVPFEMQSIHVRPRGFRVVFTKPVDKATAANPANYKLEHYRYEYTGAYGSPELDRTSVPVERAQVSADGRSVELTTASLVADRVYLLNAAGVRSADGEPPVPPTGAYTRNEIPAEAK